MRRKFLGLIVSLLAVCAAGASATAGAVDFLDTDAGDNSAPSNDRPLFPAPLFDKQPMFSRQSIKNRLADDIDRMEQPTIQAAAPNSEAMMESRIQLAQIDSEMRRQVQSVARLLYNYSLRNRSQFPSAVNSMDEVYAMQVQCQELVPNNPYNYGATETMSWGIHAQFNANGSPATGSPVWGDQWTQHLQAQNNDRVRLITNQSLMPQQVDYWASNPPDDWTAPPGTITAIGNNQGFFIVWGAGADGKPLRNPMNGKTYIVAVTTSGTVNDQSAPNQK